MALIRYSGAYEVDPPNDIKDRSGVVYQDWDYETSNEVINVNQLESYGKESKMYIYFGRCNFLDYNEI